MRLGFANVGNSCFLNVALHLVGCVVSDDDHLIPTADPAQRVRCATLGLLFAARDVRVFLRGLYGVDTIVPNTGYSFRTCIDTLRSYVMGDDDTRAQGDAVEAIHKILDLVTNPTFGHYVKQIQYVHDTLLPIRCLTCVVDGTVVNLGKRTLRDAEVLWRQLPKPRALSMLAVDSSYYRKPDLENDDDDYEDGLIVCVNHPPVDRNSKRVGIRRGCHDVFDTKKYLFKNELAWRRTEQVPETMIVLRAGVSAPNTTIAELLQELATPESVSLAPRDSALYNHVMLRKMHFGVDKVMFCMISRHAFSSGDSSKITQHVTPDLKIVMSGGLFRLRGMIYHVGIYTNHGHYVAVVWRPGDKWILIDDDKVYDVQEHLVSQQRGQQLFAAVYIRE